MYVHKAVKNIYFMVWPPTKELVLLMTFGCGLHIFLVEAVVSMHVFQLSLEEQLVHGRPGS